MGSDTSSSYDTVLKYSYPHVSETTVLDTEIHSMTIFVNRLFIGTPRFSHVGIIVYPNEFYDCQHFQSGGVLIEYGDYDYVNTKDKGYYYWYCSKNGLRYISTSDVERVYGDFIPCKVFFRMTVRELLGKICEKKEWTKSAYDVRYHDCQHFVNFAIRFLTATRYFDFQRRTSYADDYIPPIIIYELSKEERIVENMKNHPIMKFLSFLGNIFVD